MSDIQEQSEKQSARERQLAGLRPYKPGQSGNPGGRPLGSRNALNAMFLDRLSSDFREHGKQALIDAREKDPVGYVRVIAGLLPKQIEATQPLDDIGDAELLAAIAFIRSRLTQDAGEGSDPANELS